MTFFLPYNTKGEFVKNILVNLFNIMKLKEDLGCQASRKDTMKSVIKVVHIICVLYSKYLKAVVRSRPKCKLFT